MLVLTRKVGDKVVIGQQSEIVVTVVSVQGGRIRLGINAESSIPVRRESSTYTTGLHESRVSGKVQHVLEPAY